MQRVAFKMKLFKGCEAEYKKRHDELPVELKQLLKQTGIKEYSIFLDEETHILFACFTIDNIKKLDTLPQEPVMKKWWHSIKHLMETNEDASPVVTDLKEMFYLQ